MASETYDIPHLFPCDALLDLGLGRIITQDSLVEDLGLPLIEVAETEKGDRLCNLCRERDQKSDTNKNGEDSLELEYQWSVQVPKI